MQDKGVVFREKIRTLLGAHLPGTSGAIECIEAIMGAHYTAMRAADNTLSDRDRVGVGDMLFAFTTGLTFNNPFWQRASVVLLPMLAVVQINLKLAADYARAEQALPPDAPEAAALRRRAAECMGALANVVLMTVVAERGLPYAMTNGVAIRDAVEKLMEP